MEFDCEASQVINKLLSLLTRILHILSRIKCCYVFRQVDVWGKRKKVKTSNSGEKKRKGEKKETAT